MYITCPTFYIYMYKHLSCFTYGRVPAKGRNYVGTRNLRIVCYFHTVKITFFKYFQHSVKITPFKRYNFYSMDN